MDEQVITQAVHKAVDELKAVVERHWAANEPFDHIAVILATASAECPGIELKAPLSLCITPECGIESEDDEPLDDEGFLNLVRFAAKDTSACAVLRAHFNCQLGGPAITVELPHFTFQLAAPISTKASSWFWVKKDYRLDEPALPVNLAN